jgi:hypothetical protein
MNTGCRHGETRLAAYDASSAEDHPPGDFHERCLLGGVDQLVHDDGCLARRGKYVGSR